MKEQIQQLRAQGKTYDEIKSIVGCSKGTISYHCGEGQKEKFKIRAARCRATPRETIKRRVDCFIRRESMSRTSHLHQEMVDLIRSTTHCALTGIPININDGTSYEVDHIVPVSRGGTHDISNLRVVIRGANRLKNTMLDEEMYKLCEQIINFKNKQA